MTVIQLESIVTEEYDGLRFDQAVAKMWPEYSRALLSNWINEGFCLLNGKQYKVKHKVVTGDKVTINAQIEAEVDSNPEDIPLDIIYKDEDIIVLNKAANMVVHPAAGHAKGTLLNALLHHFPELTNMPRAGIVHRLDKDTTGIMVIARNRISHANLVAQLQDRNINRIYKALVKGELISSGTIEGAIGRSRYNRQKMAITKTGKEATTDYKIIKRYYGLTLLELKLHSGRTHQIRVHCTSIGHPIIGDLSYGRAVGQHKEWSDELWQQIRHFPRQALHASNLTLEHPSTKETLSWEAKLPADFEKLLHNIEPLKK